MEQWLTAFGRYLFSNWWSLLVEGVVVVSVVIFLMGVFKGLLVNKVKSRLLRKIILAWGSLILVLPATAIMVFTQGGYTGYFWGQYALNCVSTILVYWFYENTAFRDTISLIGKKVLTKMFTTAVQTRDLEAVTKSAKEEVNTTLARYRDDDLKNL